MSETTTKGRFGWVMYDWAAQPFFTVIVTFIFGPYFVNVVTGDPLRGQVLWADTQAYAGIALALTAPFLGAFADAGGRRKPWVTGCSLVTIVACSALWFATPEADDTRLFFIVSLVVIGIIGAESAIVFNNAMLPDLVSEKGLGKLSGQGWAMGYAGALLALPIMLWVTGQLPGVPGPQWDASLRIGERLTGP
ncbi:MAG: MFS transporter, partial [Chromatiales bacterium]|nr:MFS transporter [Chromatiales bacterium]